MVAIGNGFVEFGHDFLMAVGAHFATLSALHPCVQLGSPFLADLDVIVIAIFQAEDQLFSEVETLRTRQREDLFQKAVEVECGGRFYGR